MVTPAFGALRDKLGQERGLITSGWRPLWVVDFPLFEYDDEAAPMEGPTPPVYRS